MSNSDSRVVFQNVCANRCCHTRRKPEGSARTSASVGVRRREVICANPAALQLARTAIFHPKSGDENRETRGTRERKIVWTDSSTHPLGEARQFFHCLSSRLFACFALAHSRFYIESCAGLSRNGAVGNGAPCFKRRGAERGGSSEEENFTAPIMHGQFHCIPPRSSPLHSAPLRLKRNRTN